MGCLIGLVVVPVMVLASPVVLIASAFGPDRYRTNLDRNYGKVGSFILRFFARMGLMGKS